MHSVNLVIVKASNSTEARKAAVEQLESNDFRGESGMFASYPSDWFVVGGRWSGAFGVPRKKPFAKRSPYLKYGKSDDAQRLYRADEFERVKAFAMKCGNIPIHDIEEGETFKSLKSWLAFIKRENARSWPGSYEEERWAVIIDSHN